MRLNRTNITGNVRPNIAVRTKTYVACCTTHARTRVRCILVVSIISRRRRRGQRCLGDVWKTRGVRGGNFYWFTRFIVGNKLCYALLRSPSPLSLSSSVPMPMAGAQINHRSRRNIARLSFVRYTCALLSRFVRGPRADFRRMYLRANGGGALKYDPV